MYQYSEHRNLVVFSFSGIVGISALDISYDSMRTLSVCLPEVRVVVPGHSAVLQHSLSTTSIEVRFLTRGRDKSQQLQSSTS